MSVDISGRTIAQLSVLIQSGQLDPRALAEQTLSDIAGYSDQAIFTATTPERAMAEAESSAARLRDGRSRGLLEGIPIGWKDLFDLEGMTTTAGSTVLASAPPAARDAAVVEALAAAGMVSVGRLNMSEFAFSGLGINPHYGTPRNPRSPDVARIPGGSSSGSAAAVAAGLVPVAMGTDTGGSIRIPAAFNGIVGYKATRGRYAMRGVFPLARSLDALGPLCRTVQDAVWIDAAMRGLSAPDARSTALAGRRFVVPETVFLDGLEPGVAAAFEATLARLGRAGAVIRRQAFPLVAEIFEMMAAHGALVTAEAFVLHRDRLAGADAARMDPRVVARARLGEQITVSGYVETLARRDSMIAEFAASLSPDEFILSPSVAHVAPTLAELAADDDHFFRTNGKTLRNTLIGNFLDWCGVSMPCGTGEAGMPVGLLVSGLPGRDDELLGLSLAMEEIVAAGH